MSLLLALLLLAPGPAPAADVPAALTVRIEDPADPAAAMTLTVVRGTEIHLLPSGTVVVRIPGTWDVAAGVPAAAMLADPPALEPGGDAPPAVGAQPPAADDSEPSAVAAVDAAPPADPALAVGVASPLERHAAVPEPDTPPEGGGPTGLGAPGDGPDLPSFELPGERLPPQPPGPPRFGG